MKVLFICYANVARSQVAEACFKTLSQDDCHSAGIALKERVAQMKLPSKKLKHTAIQNSVEYIKREFGADVRDKERQQLVPEMIHTADLTIVIAEKEHWPDYLKEGDKILFSDIADPARLSDDGAHEVYKEVQHRVEQLVAEIG